MRKTLIAAALAASFSLLSLPALSADNGIYIGASVGQSGVQYDEDFEGENFSFDASATGFKAIAGWRFIDWLAVEANYVDLGSGDDNVHFQGSQRMLNNLIVLNKSVDFMEYPNRSHCICEGQGTTLHVYSLLTRYLLTNLPAGAR